MVNMIYILKIGLLVPLWLIVMTIRRDRAFRHHTWTLEGMRRGNFTRTAYCFCAVCWLATGALVVYLIF